MKQGTHSKATADNSQPPTLRDMLNACKALCTTNPHKATSMVREVLPQILRLNDPSLLFRAFFILSEAGHYIGDYVQERESMYEASGLEKQIQDMHEKTVFLNRFSLFYSLPHNQSFTEAIHYSNRAIASALSTKNNYLLATTYVQKGTLHFAMEEYDVALGHLYEGLQYALEQAETWQKEQNPRLLLCYDCIGTANINMGLIYTAVDEIDSALTCFNRAQACYRRAQNVFGTTSALTAAGNVLIQLQRYDQALSVLQEALLLAQRIDSPQELVRTRAELAQCYVNMEEPGLAAENIQHALSLSRHNKRSSEHILTMIALGELQSYRGEAQNAIRSFRKAEALSGEIETTMFSENIFSNLVRLYEQVGDFEQAFAFQKKYMDQRTQQQGWKQKVLRMVQQTALYTTEQRYESLQTVERQMSNRMKEYEHEIRESHLLIVQHREFVRKLKAMISPLAAQAEGRSKEIISAILETIESTHELNTEFDHGLQMFDQRFVARLKERSSKLTETELRICILARLGLSVTHIAELTHTTVNTVKTHRTHIRKKLNLTPQTNLTSFLLSL